MLDKDYVNDRRMFIRDRRIAVGKTLEDIGREVGVSKTTVQRWESGNISNMRRDKIMKLAAALDVSPTELIGYVEPTSSVQSIKENANANVLTDDERQLLKDYRALNDDGQSFVRTTVRSLVSSGAYIKSHLSGQTQIG